MKDGLVFSRLMDEFGNLDKEEGDQQKASLQKDVAAAHDPLDLNAKKADAPLMQEEERETGSVSWQVYKNYLLFAGGIVWAPTMMILLTITQAAQGEA